MLGLGEEERGVESLLSHQGVVRTLFDDLAPVDHKNPVSHFYSRKSVDDQNGDTSLSEFMKPLEQFRFCLGVHRARGLVEYQYLRITEHSSGQRDLLPFADA